VLPLLASPGSLSSTHFENGSVVECALTVDGSFRGPDWNDLLLLLDYEVRV
jgi:hypothetical protein